MLSDGLAALIAGNGAVQKLVGTPASRKDQTLGIFPGRAPESTTTPYIVYSQVSGQGLNSMDGANALHTARMQFSCYGKTYSDAKYLQRALRQLLEGLHMTLEEGTEVDSASLVIEMDGWEEAPLLHNAPIDFEFSYQDIGS